MDGEGRIELAGVREGMLDFRREGHRIVMDDRAPVIRAATTVRVGERSMRLEPEVFLDPGARLPDHPFSFRRPPHDGPDAARLGEALVALEAMAPELLATTLDHLAIVAFKDPAEDGFENLSHNDLPGASVLSRGGDALELAEALVHEAHHHRLFSLEIGEPLFATRGEAPYAEARFASPWREDPRPLYGVLHAAYVHVPVARWWKAVRDGADPGTPARERAERRLAAIARELEVGIAALRAERSWSPFGADVVGEIGSAAKEIGRA